MSKSRKKKEVMATNQTLPSIILVGMIENPKYIPTRSGMPMITFDLDGNPCKAFGAKVNEITFLFNGRVRVEAKVEVSRHKSPKKGSKLEFEVRNLKPYLNLGEKK